MLTGPLLVAGDHPEFEGQGEVKVVGGNLVSARRGALRNARRDAVARAVAERIPAEKLEALRVRLRSSIYRRASRYIRTYRVLEEGRQGSLFRIRVAVALNSKRLQSDLDKLLGATTKPGQRGTARIGLWLVVTPPDAGLEASMRARAQATLGGAGYSAVKVVQKPGRDWANVGRARSTAFLIKATVELARASGVRGLDLQGARATARVWLGMVATKTGMAESTEQAWGAGAQPQEASSAAARRALDRALGLVLARLGDRLRPGKLSAGQRVLHVSGLTSYRQYHRITRILREQIPGVTGCELRRVGKGEVWYAVATNHSAKRLAGALERQTFGGFMLKTRNIVGGSAWMIIKPVPDAGS